MLFTVYDFVLMLVLVPALLLAARPQQFSASPLRSVSQLAGRAQLQHLPVALPAHPGHLRAWPAAGASRRDDGYWWRLPVILVLTLVFATVSYHLVERPGMEWGRRLAKRVSGGRRRAARTRPTSKGATT